MMGKQTAGSHTLEDAATKFLRKRGFRWDGRSGRGTEGAQVAFERRIISTPMGRANRRRLK